ncbi:hypothetical protein [Clavibacter michiganensis]|uniref:hypothetical protein n=1 Tax=Clavibacter michiganensis TaxID=28447 RepID=UPI001FF08454|nr:hypothetical protein [Clavibacter michiganensis]
MRITSTSTLDRSSTSDSWSTVSRAIGRVGSAAGSTITVRNASSLPPRAFRTP